MTDEPKPEDESSEDARITSSIGGFSVSSVSLGRAVANSSQRYDNYIRLNALRDWWLGIKARSWEYQVYAFFLTLSSDKDALLYITEHIKELDAISGNDCLVLLLSQDVVYRHGLPADLLDDDISASSLLPYDNAGLSPSVARFLEIPLQRLPCMVLFKDIRSSERAIVSLKGMSVQDISYELRETFDIVRDAIKGKKDIVKALIQNQKSEARQQTGKSVLQKIGIIASISYEKAIEALFDSLLKKSP